MANDIDFLNSDGPGSFAATHARIPVANGLQSVDAARDRVGELSAEATRLGSGRTVDDAVEAAVDLLRRARAVKDALAAVEAAARLTISEAIEETGKTRWETRAGTAYVTSTGQSVTFDARALEALVKSDPALARILDPHRTVKTTGGSLTVRFS